MYQSAQVVTDDAASTALDGDARPASSIERAVTVLDALSATGDSSLGVSEVALTCRLPKSSTHRLLQELERQGLVSRCGRKYRLGGRLFQLVTTAEHATYGRLRDAATPSLEALFDRTGFAVYLGVLDRGDVVVIDQIASRSGRALP